MAMPEEDALRESVRTRARAARAAQVNESYGPEVLHVVESAWRRKVPVEQVSPWFTDPEGRNAVWRDARAIIGDLERARERVPDVVPDLFEILRNELKPSH